MRSSALAALLLLAACALPAHAATKVATDAFEVVAPAKDWKRAPALDSPGRLTWNSTDMKQTQGQLRVTFDGAPGEDANHALQRILDLEKARVRDTTTSIAYAVNRSLRTTCSSTR